MDETHLHAYFAGAIDADGYITISRTTKPSVAWTPTYYGVRVGFTGTAEPRVQELLKTHFGGSLCRFSPRCERHRPWTTWDISGPKAAAFLRAILPYLVTKRVQAQKALDLQDLIHAQVAEMRQTQKPPYRLTDVMLEERHRLWEEVSRLNAPTNRRRHILPASDE